MYLYLNLLLKSFFKTSFFSSLDPLLRFKIVLFTDANPVFQLMFFFLPITILSNPSLSDLKTCIQICKWFHKCKLKFANHLSCHMSLCACFHTDKWLYLQLTPTNFSFGHTPTCDVILSTLKLAFDLKNSIWKTGHLKNRPSVNHQRGRHFTTFTSNVSIPLWI